MCVNLQQRKKYKEVTTVT